MTLKLLAMPAAASKCPRFVFTDPTRSGRPAARPFVNTSPSALTSMGSPKGVAVPWAST